MRDHRSPPWWRALVAATLTLFVAVAGCGDDGGGTGAGPDSAGPGDTHTQGDIAVPDAGTGGPDGTTFPDVTIGDGVGEPDLTYGAGISIDEAGIRGLVQGGNVTLTVPVASIDDDGVAGKLRVTIREVDDGPVVATGEASFDIPGGETAKVDVTLPMPDVADQAALARYVVRVEDSWTEAKDGPRVTRSLLAVLPAYSIALEGPKSLLPGKTSAWRIRANDPVSHAPLAGVPVRLEITSESGDLTTLDGETGLTGDAIFELALPEPGNYDVAATGSTQGTMAVIADTIEVVESPRRILLTTDKPIYQPGQTIHLRALALEKPDLAPLAQEDVVFEVEDGKGNKILKRSIASDDYGIASTEFILGKILNEGTFKIRALIGTVKTEKTVEVTRYALPKFKVDTKLGQPWYTPGTKVTGAVDALYFFGKPIAGGTVDLVASTLDVGATPFQQVTGKTDATGHWEFEITLPQTLVGLPLEQGKAVVELAFVVTDTADQVVEKSVAVIVSASPAQVLLVPESGVLVPGTDNVLHLFVTDPLGAPVGGALATLKGAVFPEDLAVETDAFGYVQLLVPVAANVPETTEVTATVTLPGGGAADTTFALSSQAGAEHLVLRTDKAIYDVGETVKVDVVTTGASKNVYVDWLNQGQVVDMRTLDAKNNKAVFTMDLDTSLLGDNTVEAYIVDSEGQIVRARRAFFVKDAGGLSVSLATDKPIYAPGEPAELTFSVADEEGKPTVAALGVQIVDQAVFALVDARPGLLETYFALNDALATPQYEIHGASWNMASLIFDGSSSSEPGEADAAQTQAEAAFAAMGGGGVTGLFRTSWADLPKAVGVTLEPYYTEERAQLLPLYGIAAQVAVSQLEAEGCAPGSYWCQVQNQEYLVALADKVKNLVAAYDFWGTSYESSSGSGDGTLRVRSAGPDEIVGTPDDWTTVMTYDELGLPDELQWVQGPWEDDVDGGFEGGGAGGGGGGPADPNAGGEQPPSPNEGEGEDGPRVRSDFPETLYVNPALITGPDGKATVNLDMADSITEWRVSSLAHTLGGKLGSGVSGITVFQDFFVDIDFPATLTRGDEVSFPIAIYNYLDVPQSVTITLEPDDWYTALGATEAKIDLAPQQVAVAKFPVRVDEVGIWGLTVKGLGTTLSDAVHRVVTVVPDGKENVATHSGALEAGTVEYTVNFPPEAVPGSEVLYMNLYPAYLTQVVEGLDSMLSVPYG